MVLMMINHLVVHQTHNNNRLPRVLIIRTLAIGQNPSDFTDSLSSSLSYAKLNNYDHKIVFVSSQYIKNLPFEAILSLDDDFDYLWLTDVFGLFINKFPIPYNNRILIEHSNMPTSGSLIIPIEHFLWLKNVYIRFKYDPCWNFDLNGVNFLTSIVFYDDRGEPTCDPAIDMDIRTQLNITDSNTSHFMFDRSKLILSSSNSVPILKSGVTPIYMNLGSSDYGIIQMFLNRDNKINESQTVGVKYIEYSNQLSRINI